MCFFPEKITQREFLSAAAVDVGGGTHSARHSAETPGHLSSPQMQQKHEGTSATAANTSRKLVPTGAASDAALPPTELNHHPSSSVCTRCAQGRQYQPALLSSYSAIRFDCAINQKHKTKGEQNRVLDVILTVGVGAVVLVPRLHDDGVGSLQHRGRRVQRSAPRNADAHHASVPRRRR